MHKELLYSLLDAVTVSGCEEAGQEISLAAGAAFAQEQAVDAVGNVISTANPGAPCRVLLCGHIDEIGFRVTHIRDDGMLRVQKAGGVRPALYVGSPMQVIHEETENGARTRRKVRGVGVVTPELIKKADVADEDLIIDIGATSREEAATAVAVGDPVCADIGCRELLHDRFSARAIDDRAGAFIVLEAAREAVAQGARCGISVNTCVGEETSGRGAYFAGAAVQPTCAIVVDVTWASDCPGTDPGTTGDVRLGGGPVLCHSGVVNKRMNALLAETARELDIPVQYEVAGDKTWTDGDTLLRTGAGVPVALVSLPVRYMHSSVEVSSWKDVEACIRLIAGFLGKLDASFDFRPLVP